MGCVIVTGSAGLIGAETVRRFCREGFDVYGIDNDMRAYYFGGNASTKPAAVQLARECATYRHHAVDIRDRTALKTIFERAAGSIDLVVHTAAQPSHDWAVREPHTDFGVNAVGTLNLLELTRQYAPEAPFIFTSTNKVYGDTPNALPLLELETRWELDSSHPFAAHGIDESMSIDRSKHSLFGASKLAADVLVQEYGRYFQMRTACFRCGCLTGPGHAGAELHGFLAYLMHCAVTGAEYRIFGYGGKQVRDNLHATDLVDAFWHYFTSPRCAAVYNLGGGRFANCSLHEAIDLCNERTGRKLPTAYVDQPRSGDHIWWISDNRRFQLDYPQWRPTRDISAILAELHEAMLSLP